MSPSPMSNQDAPLVPAVANVNNGHPPAHVQQNPALPNQASIPMPSDYLVSKEFVPGSKLRVYLAQKRPQSKLRIRKRTTINEVLQMLRDIISDEKLYDESNASVILCDKRLEEALNVKALHLSEIRDHIAKQLTTVDDTELIDTPRSSIRNNLTSFRTAAAATADLAKGGKSPAENPISRSNPGMPLLGGHSTGAEPGELSPRQNASSSSSLSNPSAKPATSASVVAVPSNSLPSVPTGHVIVRPSNNSPPNAPRRINSAAAAALNLPLTSRIASTAYLGHITSDCRFRVKPAFKVVLNTLDEVDPNQTIFTYEQLTNYLSTYILAHKDEIFDGRNIKVAMVENDLLGKAFGVRAFHRTQVTHLLRTQLIRVRTESSIDDGNDSSENGKTQEVVGTSSANQQVPEQRPDPSPKANDESNSRGTKRINEICETQQASSSSPVEGQHVVKKMRRKSSQSSSYTTYEINIYRRNGSSNSVNEESGVSSEDESIYSAQGYETVEVSNMFSSGDFSEESENDEDVFDDEFELATDEGEDNADMDNPVTGSEDDSDFKDVVIASSIALALDASSSDCMADSESDFELSNWDPEVGPKSTEVWKCLQCDNPNPPRVRYCDKCWQERKNWLPHRPKPHKQRKDKKTKNQRVKSSKKNSNDCSSTSLSFSGSSGSSSTKVPTDVEGETKGGGGDDGIESGSSEGKTTPDFDRQNSQESHDSGCGSSQNLLDDPDDIRSTMEDMKSKVEELSSSAKVGTLSELRRASTAPASSAAKADLLCKFCLIRDMNAGIIHGGIIHQVCCYPCAKKCMKRRQPCPICRRRIEKIAKIIVA